MAKMDVKEKVFELPIAVDAAGEVSKTLATADTYVDKNIKVIVNTPDAEFELKKDGAVTATVGVTANQYTSDTETKYAIEVTADATAAESQVGVKTAGFAAATDTITLTGKDAEQDKKVTYIKEGSLSIEGSASAQGNVSLTKVGSTPTDKFYIEASAAGTVNVGKAGWIPKDYEIPAGEGSAIYTLPNVLFKNTADDADSYADIDDKAPVLIEDGYLFIDEGYIGKSKISLAKLVPDGTDIKGGEEWLYQGHTARDDDGNLVTGTMGDAELGVWATAEAKIDTIQIGRGEEDAYFTVYGSTNINGDVDCSVMQVGYVGDSTPNYHGSVSGDATVEVTLDKVGLGIDADDLNITVTPEITQETSTAKTGEISTTQPSSGKYVAVSTEAISASKEVSPEVISEGYGTTDVFDATSATVVAGATASGTYYIPLTAGTHSDESTDPTVVNATANVTQSQEGKNGFEGNLSAGFLAAAPSEGAYIEITADGAVATKGSVSGNVTCTVTEGYVDDWQETKTISGEVDVSITAAATKYLRVYDGTIL